MKTTTRIKRENLEVRDLDRVVSSQKCEFLLNNNREMNEWLEEKSTCCSIAESKRTYKLLRMEINVTNATLSPLPGGHKLCAITIKTSESTLLGVPT
jgi:hypothetical protein